MELSLEELRLLRAGLQAIPITNVSLKTKGAAISMLGSLEALDQRLAAEEEMQRSPSAAQRSQSLPGRTAKNSGPRRSSKKSVLANKPAEIANNGDTAGSSQPDKGNQA